MATCASFQVQMVSIMDVLTKTAVAEITKLVDDASAELRLEMCRSQRENEALKSKLLVMEGELREARGCGEGTPGSSLNIAFEVKVCDEFREAHNAKVGGDGSVAAERDLKLSTGPVKDEQYAPTEKKKTVPDALDIKYEPVDGEQDWSEYVLLSEDWLEEDTKTSQSQLEQKISVDDACGPSGAAAANGGEGPLCEEEKDLHMQPCPAGDPEKRLQAELKQEPDGDPLTPGHPLPRSAEGLEVQCAWSKSTRSEKVQEILRQHGGGLEHGGTLGAAAANGGEGPLYEEEEDLHMQPCPAGDPEKRLQAELEQEPDGEPFIPRHQLQGSAEGLRVQCVWSMATRSGKVREMHRHHGGGLEHGGARSNNRLSPRHFRASGRLRSEKNEGPTKPFACVQCGKSFSQISGLKTHQITHTGEKCFQCTVCNKSFAFLHILKRHQRVHAGEKCLLCKLCGKLFDGADSLKQHHRSHHGGKRFRCTLCGKGFTAKIRLKTHQRVHNGEKPHSCDTCGMSFTGLSHLKTHQRIHTGEKPYSCDTCGMSFTRLSHVKSHERVHTREKPHRCDECGKSFAQLCTLKTHQRVHTGEKPYSCDKCGMSFAVLSTLIYHKRIHTGEKPHSCDECGKSFTQLCTLKRHQMVHTGEKPHSCDECGKNFTRLSHLKTHQCPQRRETA